MTGVQEGSARGFTCVDDKIAWAGNGYYGASVLGKR